MNSQIKKVTVEEGDVVLVLSRQVVKHIIATYEWIAADLEDLEEMAQWYGLADRVRSFL